MKRSICLAAALAALSGCASYEWRNDSANANWEVDLNDCRVSALSLYPKTIVQEREIDRAATDAMAAEQRRQQEAARAYSSSTTCNRAGRSVQCDTHGSVPAAQVVVVQPPPVVYRTRAVDVNARDRDGYTQTCIASRGWRRVRVDG